MNTSHPKPIPAVGEPVNRQRKRPRNSLTAFLRSWVRFWFGRKRPVLWMVVKIVALMSLYYGFILTPWYNHGLSGFLNANARLASGIMNWFGEKSQVSGATIWSDKFAITILKECSGFEFMWFYCATVIAFPAALSRKVPGIVAGIVLMLALNVVRAMVLYLAGVHSHAFDLVHLDLWPPVSSLTTIGFTVAWIAWAKREEPTNALA